MNETISVSVNQRRVGLANKAMLNGSKNIDTSLESIASVDSLRIKKVWARNQAFPVFENGL